jgi:hypothetical protein
MRIIFIVLLIILPFAGSCQVKTGSVICTEYQQLMLTHGLTVAGPVPTALDPNGIYPYVSYSETSNRPVPVKYTFLTLENDLIKVTICPDLGGKVTSMIHKPSGKEVLYKPDVIRPTRILPRFYFVAGGIEVSFPVSHSPSQNEKVLYKLDETPGRSYITCGERELRFGLQWSVEYSLGPSDNFLTQRVKMYNPGTNSYPWMSWSNAAIPSAPDTEFQFPKGTVLSHSSILDTIDWESEGPQRQQDINEMTGFFWKTSDINAFGAFTQSSGTGLYHVADKNSAPGIKLWSYGVKENSDWALQSTASNEPYIEIQGGPVSDQSIKLELAPGKTLSHVEYWIPADKALNIYSISVPELQLRNLSILPLFDWSRPEEVNIWIELSNTYTEKSTPPDPPEIQNNCWAPSGMEGLKSAFEWVIMNSGPEKSNLWKFYYGAWAAGRGEVQQAITILKDCRIGLAKALLARLLRMEGDNEGAVKAYNSIEEQWLRLHPQVIIERDKALRNLGKKTLKERDYWLSQADALQDEWVIERRVQWLIDNEEAAAARKLLLSVNFQKVHQVYTRTELWFQICDQLNESRFPIPAQLGEDRLAKFGAYREFE